MRRASFKKVIFGGRLAEVWAQFSQHPFATIWNVDKTFRFGFSVLLVGRCTSFMRQK